MDSIVFLITAVGAYLAGSIPTGFLAGKARGIDIRKVGSGNIGATNVLRILGKKAGFLVLLVDALKGFVAVAVIPMLVTKIFSSGAPQTEVAREYLKITGGVMAILGHNYTCWLKFKGGKGIATSAGVLAALMPLAFLISLSTFLLVCRLTRYVSLASILAALVLPFGAWAGMYFYGYSLRLVVLASLIGALAIYKHKANISRLLNGTESKIGQKPTPPPVSGAA